MIAEVCNDMRILHAFAARLNHMAIALPPVEANETESVRQMAQVAREFAEYFAEVSQTLADRNVTPNELVRCEKELGDLMAAAQKLGAHLKFLSEQGKV